MDGVYALEIILEKDGETIGYLDVTTQDQTIIGDMLHDVNMIQTRMPRDWNKVIDHDMNRVAHFRLSIEIDPPESDTFRIQFLLDSPSAAYTGAQELKSILSTWILACICYAWTAFDQETRLGYSHSEKGEMDT